MPSVSIQRIADSNDNDRPVTAFDCFMKYMSNVPVLGGLFG